jgi:excisionase family DNA binding protein
MNPFEKTFELADFMSAKEAREFLGLSLGKWKYLLKFDFVTPIPFGRGREYGKKDKRTYTAVYSRRQLDELKDGIESGDNYDDLSLDIQPLPEEETAIMTVHEAAREMNLSSDTLRARLMRSEGKEIPFKKVGNQYLLLRRDVEYWR